MPIRIHVAALFLSVAALFISGCARNVSRTANFGTPDNVIAYGVYTATALDSGFSVKLSLNQNNTYSRKKYQGSCFIAEFKGEWKCDNESVDFALQEIRRRPDCTTESWQVQKVEKNTRRLLRQVTTNSFELLDQDEGTSDEWIKFVKR